MRKSKILVTLTLMAMASVQCLIPVNAYGMSGTYMNEAAGGDIYAVSGTQITVSVTEGTDVTKTLNKALEQARDQATDSVPVTVSLPKGNYNQVHYIFIATQRWI